MEKALSKRKALQALLRLLDFLFHPLDLFDGGKTRVITSGIDVLQVLDEVRFRYHRVL
jgi:hypothetical protein